GYQLVAADVHLLQRLLLRKAVVQRARDKLPVRKLFVPPNGDLVRRAADDVVAAVAVHVVNMHLRAFVAQIGRDELPACSSWVGGSVPVTAAADALLGPVGVGCAGG